MHVVIEAQYPYFYDITSQICTYIQKQWIEPYNIVIHIVDYSTITTDELVNYNCDINEIEEESSVHSCIILNKSQLPCPCTNIKNSVFLTIDGHTTLFGNMFHVIFK